MNAFYKSILNLPSVKKSAKYSGILGKVLDLLEKQASKYVMRGNSQHGIISVKMDISMRLQEVKIMPEMLMDLSKLPPHEAERLKKICEVIEVEFMQACNNAQNGIYRKATISSKNIQ